MFKHLLIPTDGSDLGTRAVHAGIDFARSIGATVTVITVSQPFHLLTVDDPFWYLQTEKMYLEATAKVAHKILKAAEDYAASKGVQTDTLHVYHDNVHKAILEAAKGCDLIFMASHGHKGVVALVLGSVTAKVLTHSPIPVLVWRG
jgi:nucleotide-binding universal stress UspA family protein